MQHFTQIFFFFQMSNLKSSICDLANMTSWLVLQLDSIISQLSGLVFGLSPSTTLGELGYGSLEDYKQ